MSDLISRSAVIDVLKETGIIQDNDLGHLVVGEIERIPTAYNVDKVVEELEEAYFWTPSTFDSDGFSNDDSQEVVELDKAIEIVKGGGVNE